MEGKIGNLQITSYTWLEKTLSFCVPRALSMWMEIPTT